MRSFPLQRLNASRVCIAFTVHTIVSVVLAVKLYKSYNEVAPASLEPSGASATNTIAFSRHHLNVLCPETPSKQVLRETVPHVAECKAEHMIAGTQLAQYELWRHQNPETCDGKKFLVALVETGESSGARKMKGRGRGIGSLIQIAAVNLLLAKRNDRILVFDSKHDTNWASAPMCSSSNMFLCHFLPITNCTVSQEDIDSAGDFPPRELWGHGPCSNYGKCATGAARVLRTTKNFGFRYQDMFNLPDVGPLYAAELRAMDCAYVAREKQIYWAVMQAMAYLTRLQDTTRAAIRSLQADAFDNRTLAPQTVSIHMRFGDKSREGSLQSEQRYITLANSISANYSAYFVSTEDQLALDRVRDQLTRPVWFVRGKRLAREERETALTELARQGDASGMFVDAWLNLLLAIQCDAYIGTLSSTWNRMLDALRSTVGCKAQAKYYDPTPRRKFSERLPHTWHQGGEFFWSKGAHVFED